MSTIAKHNDKIIHATAGYFIGLLLAAFASLWMAPFTACFFGFLVASVASVLKEVAWDWYMGRGEPDLVDALATAAGGLIGAVLFKLLTI